MQSRKIETKYLDRYCVYFSLLQIRECSMLACENQKNNWGRAFTLESVTRSQGDSAMSLLLGALSRSQRWRILPDILCSCYPTKTFPRLVAEVQKSKCDGSLVLQTTQVPKPSAITTLQVGKPARHPLLHEVAPYWLRYDQERTTHRHACCNAPDHPPLDSESLAGGVYIPTARGQIATAPSNFQISSFL